MNTQDTLPPSQAPLSPFDAVARAMDMASLLAGAVAHNQTDKANTYSARLRAHLVRCIYPAEQAQQAQGVPASVPRIATPEMRARFREAYREGGFWSDRLDYALDQMLAAAPQAEPQPEREPLSYRLLTALDTIQADDEFLQEDCISWAIDANAVFAGARYQPGSCFRVARRKLAGIGTKGGE